MELDVIEVDREQAKVLFEEYAEAVRTGRDAEDEAIARGYRALASGKRLIHLTNTLRAAGVTEVDGRVVWSRQTQFVTVPNLAVVRAGAKVAFTDGINRNGGCQITADKKARDLHFKNSRDRMRIADGTFSDDAPEQRSEAYVRAIVPNIPPRLRPKRGLHLYTILWEAEWAIDPVPPIDPALLRHLGGDLYVVIGTWDLTPLERAVLEGRL